MRKSPWLALSLLLQAVPTQSQSPPAPMAPRPAAATLPAPPEADDHSVAWTLDPAHSHIGFVARHLGFAKINGHFSQFSADVRADPKTAKLTSLEATVQTASVSTGIDKRDRHLRSDDFLSAEKFPELKLISRRIRWHGSRFTANTDLTIRGVTRPVSFKGRLLGVHKVNFGQGEQLRAGYEASATIHRKDFGLAWDMVTEGLAVVADPVQIDLCAELSYANTTPTARTPGRMPSALAVELPAAGPSTMAERAAVRYGASTTYAVTPAAPAKPARPQMPTIAAPHAPTTPTVVYPPAGSRAAVVHHPAPLGAPSDATVARPSARH